MTDLRKAEASLLSAVDLALPYAARIVEWAISTPRKAAALAFTAGPERQAAYWIEWAEARERERWEIALCAVMPPDFKDWHANSPSERPAVAAWVISNLREREDALSRLLEKNNALALNAAKLQAEVEALRRDAERLDSKRILVHSRDEFGEPVSVLHTGIDLRAAIDAARAQKGE